MQRSSAVQDTGEEHSILWYRGAVSSAKALISHWRWLAYRARPWHSASTLGVSTVTNALSACFIIDEINVGLHEQCLVTSNSESRVAEARFNTTMNGCYEVAHVVPIGVIV